MQKVSKRVGEMEFLRFVFSIIIVFHHSRGVVGNETALFLNGAFAVEFFFILSGFLMMKSISKMDDKYENLGIETAQFIKKKYLSLCPEMIISWIIGAVATAIVGKYTFEAVFDTFCEGIWELGLLTMTGIKMSFINDAVWYLSSMLLCMAIIYPILRKYKTTAKLVIIPIVTFLIYGYFIMQTHSIRAPFKLLGFTYRGNLRAFADLGVGIMAYQVTEVFKEKKLTVFSKLLLTIVKYIGVISLVAYMYCYRKPKLGYDMFLIFIIAIIICLIFSGQTYGGGIFNNRFVGFLGKFSLPFYLSHFYWVNLIKTLLPESFDKTKATIIYFIVSIVTAAIVMLLSTFIRKYKPFSKIKPLFAK